MPLSDIVNVTITRQTTAVSRAGFGTALVVGAHLAFVERLKYYSNQASVLLDFLDTDPIAKATADYFAQNPTPVRVAIGRRKADDPVTITVTVAHDDTDYIVTINGTDFTFDSGTGATVTTIKAGLVAAINAGAEPVTATSGTAGVLTLSADVANTPYSLSVSPTASIAVSALTITETIGTTMTAIKDEQPDFYGIVLADRTQATVELLAAWVETQKYIFLTASSESDIVDVAASSDTTSIAAKLKAQSYARSGCIYSAGADTEYPDAALFGVILPKDPGSYTAMFKTLASITVDLLTDTQSTNALAKNCNVYQEIGGVSIVREGKVAEGEYIDIIVFVDWLQARMTERLYSRFVNLPKIPFTDAGIGIVEADIKAQLQEGVNRGGLSASPAFTVTVPKAIDVSSADKIARLLPDVSFLAYLAGAIHSTTINGVVTL